MKLIDGRKIAEGLRLKIAKRVKTLSRPPGLAMILVGDDPASHVYVKNKQVACQEVGFYSKNIHKSASISQQELLDEIALLNNDDNIDGILLQLPLPPHLDAHQVIESIDPTKDVDGFHSINIGKLVQNKPFLHPCTPRGVMHMLDTIGVDLVGMNAVVIGSSNIVGRPMAVELLNARATVTVCNSKTKDLAAQVRQADIVVVAVGVANMVTGEWIKKDAIVIDVGINRLDNGTITGDVDFHSVKEKALWITPVPGGVGPMTIVTLLENTLMAYEARE